jgi:hypothetical protein
MMNASDIKEHMDVIGSDGKHVGTVDHMEGDDRIKLTKSDPASGGQHHFIPMSWIAEVDAHVHLNLPADKAMQQWTNAS